MAIIVKLDDLLHARRMRLTELGCTAPHPDFPELQWRWKLAEAVPESVRIERRADVPPGCTLLRCRRCGTEYVVCRVARSA